MSLADLMADGQANNPDWSPDTFENWARAKHETSLRIFEIFHTPIPDSSDIVARIGVPVLLITGDVERGVIISPERAAEFQALNPRLRVVNVDGVGHCIRYEQPDRYATIVRDFLHEVFTD